MIRNPQLTGLIGWKQSGPFTLEAENLASSSGRHYNEFCSAVTAENLYYTQPDVNINAVGFNLFLNELVNGSIQQLLNSVFRNVDDLIENKFLYPYEFDFRNELDNGTDFVGFEIKVSKRKDIASVINKLMLTFNGDDIVKILVFNSGFKEPVYEKEVSVLENTSVEDVVDWVLDHKGGKYYLGYLTSGLTSKAYDRRFEIANVRTCFTGIDFKPIRVVGHNSETLFDVNDIVNESFSWGLNFDVSVWKDWTELINTNKSKLIDAIGMQVCVNALDVFLTSTRSNTDERISRANALLALEGNTNPAYGPFVTGLRTRLEKEIKWLRKIVDPPLISKSTLS